MKIIFFGTPDYVLPIIEILYKQYEIVGVVTQPPKPVGREKILAFSPVDSWAHKKKIPIFFDFTNLPEADLGVCASFGMIIPQETISQFKHGILNIHPSILPKYRGASPIQTAIANSDSSTGVTIIKMDNKMDHGPILTSFNEEISADDTFKTLREKLFNRSAQVLVDLIPNYIKGRVKLKKQDEQNATYTKLVNKQDGYIDLTTSSPKVIFAKFKAYSPWPGIWTLLHLNSSGQAKRLKIVECHLENEKLVIDEVQLEGKKPVSFKQFKSSYPLIF